MIRKQFFECGIFRTDAVIEKILFDFIVNNTSEDVALLQEVKEVKRARLTEYAAARPSAQYHDKATEGTNQWEVKVDIALPCATQNELLIDDAKQLVANGVKAVCEGANMPTELDAIRFFNCFLDNFGMCFVF